MIIKLAKWEVLEEKNGAAILIGYGDVLVAEDGEHVVVKLESIKRELNVIAVNSNY
jgi:hypothetical protein